MEVRSIPSNLTEGDPEVEVIRTLIFLKEYGVEISWENWVPSPTISYGAGGIDSSDPIPKVTLPKKPTHLVLYTNKNEVANMERINVALFAVSAYEEYQESMKPNKWSEGIKKRLESNLNPDKKPEKSTDQKPTPKESIAIPELPVDGNGKAKRNTVVDFRKDKLEKTEDSPK